MAIQVDLARSFDTQINVSLQATGFVVDAKRGLILTNRHVVTPGPVTAQGVFLDREELQLYPVYRDPVHDFGFYRYDPAKLRFIVPQQIALSPAGAQVGTEIGVVGNDAGEQLSFLAGTLARLDRQAPVYGVGKYNDFDTFYYQAASNTSGGSSGSPVIDVHGRAVALNAGAATGAASSFYLPLGRVVRAMRYIDRNTPVPRGTLETVFNYTPFDELRRLGLRPETEVEVRATFPKQIGMLVVTQIQPGSTAQGALEVGDVLLRINGHLVTEFASLADVLDDSVGTSLRVQLQRRERTLELDLPVSDLYTISPDTYLELGGAVLHNLSYQQARHLSVPITGVYLANPGYMFGAAGIFRGAVITRFDGKTIRNIDDLQQAIAGLADGDRVMVRYFTADDLSASQLRPVTVDRRWFSAQRCTRDDARGYWPCERGGVITDKSGEVLALWSTFAFDNGRETTEQDMGIPAEVVRETLDAIRRGGELRSLEAEFSIVPVSTLLKLGLDPAWLRRVQLHNPGRSQLLNVARLVAGTPAARVLQTGDLLLSIDGQVATRFREVERASQKPRVHLVVWRDGAC